LSVIKESKQSEYTTFTAPSGQEKPAGSSHFFFDEKSEVRMNRTPRLQNKDKIFALDAADIIDYC
jgi:hypothetical protein